SFLAGFVDRLYLLHPFNSQRILLVVIRIAVPHQVFEDVPFLQMGYSLNGLQVLYMIGEYRQSVHIGIQFVVEAALKPAALARKFGLIDRQVLVAGGSGIHRLEICKPRAAAQLTAAGAYAAYLAALL